MNNGKQRRKIINMESYKNRYVVSLRAERSENAQSPETTAFFMGWRVKSAMTELLRQLRLSK